MKWKQIFLKFELNEYMELMALFSDSYDFCGNGSHFASLSTSDFAGDGTHRQAQGTEGTPEEEKEKWTVVPIGDEVELIRKTAIYCAEAGILS